jgi:hypothetical protein
MDVAREPGPSSQVVRQVLAGLHGPDVDPQEALDALDHVEKMMAELDGDGVVDLVSALAERLPALVVAQARAWVGPSDSSVVAGLGAHHHRIAVATAVRPWDEQAIRAVETAARRQEWHEAELDAVLRVMRDDAPELTAPRGVGDVDLGGRWWIVAERLWDWTLWRCDDGRAVLERVEGGVGMWTSVQALSDDAAADVVAAVVAGIELTGREIAPSPPGS